MVVYRKSWLLNFHTQDQPTSMTIKQCSRRLKKYPGLHLWRRLWRHSLVSMMVEVLTLHLFLITLVTRSTGLYWRNARTCFKTLHGMAALFLWKLIYRITVRQLTTWVNVLNTSQFQDQTIINVKIFSLIPSIVRIQYSKQQEVWPEPTLIIWEQILKRQPHP